MTKNSSGKGQPVLQQTAKLDGLVMQEDQIPQKTPRDLEKNVT